MSGRENKISLSTDVTGKQLTVFYILLGMGCLAHEWAWWMRYVGKVGANLGNYLDGYRELMPTPELAFPLVILIHLLFVLLAFLTILDKRRSLWSLLQLPTIVALYFVQGMKPSNHLFFLILVFAVRPDLPVSLGLNRSYLRLNLLILLCSTYFVAALVKVNPVFMNPETTGATEFVYPPFWPVRGMPVQQLAQIAGQVSNPSETEWLTMSDPGAAWQWCLEIFAVAYGNRGFYVYHGFGLLGVLPLSIAMCWFSMPGGTIALAGRRVGLCRVGLPI